MMMEVKILRNLIRDSINHIFINLITNSNRCTASLAVRHFLGDFVWDFGFHSCAIWHTPF